MEVRRIERAEGEISERAFSVLVYYYGLMKKMYKFSLKRLREYAGRSMLDDTELVKLMQVIQNEGYMEGIEFNQDSGNGETIIPDFENAQITSKGIDYVTNNEEMRHVMSISRGSISELIDMVL